MTLPAKKLLILAAFGLGLALFFALGGRDLLDFEQINENRERFAEWKGANFWSALASAVFVYVAVTALSVPGATVLSLVIGFLFGRWLGTVIIVFAATIGASLVFVVARYLFHDAVRALIERNPRAATLMDGFSRDAFHYLIFLRLAPFFPFWLVNLASAFTPIPLRVFSAATFIGIIPGSFVYANLGRSLAHVDSPAGLVSVEVLAALALLGLSALAPIVVRRLRGNHADS